MTAFSIQPAIYHREPFAAHVGAVETLAANGIKPPEAWTGLRNRHAEYMQLGNRHAGLLSAEIITGAGDPDHLATLRNLALLDEMATGEAELRINAQVQQAVLEQLQGIYRPCAEFNYRLARERYDELGRRFTLCATGIDVEAGADTLGRSDKRQRQAWFDATEIAPELENALRVLCAAAALAGAPPDVAFLNRSTDAATVEYQIAIALDPGKAHRRQTWLAWGTTGGRTGRWGPLAALGVKLQAASRPDRVKPYKRPAQPVQVLDPAGVVRSWDPHDGKPPAGWKRALQGWYEGGGNDSDWGD